MLSFAAFRSGKHYAWRRHRAQAMGGRGIAHQRKQKHALASFRTAMDAHPRALSYMADAGGAGGNGHATLVLHVCFSVRHFMALVTGKTVGERDCSAAPGAGRGIVVERDGGGQAWNLW